MKRIEPLLAEIDAYLENCLSEDGDILRPNKMAVNIFMMRHILKLIAAHHSIIEAAHNSAIEDKPSPAGDELCDIIIQHIPYCEGKVEDTDIEKLASAVRRYEKVKLSAWLSDVALDRAYHALGLDKE